MNRKPKSPRLPKPKERDILNGCLAVLRLRGIFHFRQNVGGAEVQSGHFIRFGVKGCSDILGCLPDGRFLAIEVKRPGKKPTADQSDFLQSITNHGGLAIVVHSVDELIQELDNGRKNEGR